MDITPIVTSVASGVLSITAVSAFVAKYLTKTVKYVRISKDALVLLDYVVEALEDGQLTPEESDRIKAEAAQLKADFQS